MKSKSECRRVPVFAIAAGALVVIAVILKLFVLRRKCAEEVPAESAKPVNIGEPEYNTLEDVTSPPPEEEAESTCD